MVFERETIKYGEPYEAEEEQTPIKEEGADEEEEEEEEEMVLCLSPSIVFSVKRWISKSFITARKGSNTQKNAEDRRNIGQFNSSGQTRDSRTNITKQTAMDHPGYDTVLRIKETIRQKCEQTVHCMHAQERLEACETRVGSRSHTEEDCTEELFDFFTCTGPLCCTKALQFN